MATVVVLYVWKVEVILSVKKSFNLDTVTSRGSNNTLNSSLFCILLPFYMTFQEKRRRRSHKFLPEYRDRCAAVVKWEKQILEKLWGPWWLERENFLWNLLFSSRILAASSFMPDFMEPGRQKRSNENQPGFRLFYNKLYYHTHAVISFVFSSQLFSIIFNACQKLTYFSCVPAYKNIDCCSCSCAHAHSSHKLHIRHIFIVNFFIFGPFGKLWIYIGKHGPSD